jgi:hypothetical protein
MRFPLPRRRFWRAAIYLCSLVLVLLALDVILVQARRTIHPGFSTTRITSPTLPDGMIDYMVALDEQFGRGVTPENNAAIPILQALGRQALWKAQPADSITDKLGMPHLPEQGDYFIGLDEYARQHPLADEEARGGFDATDPFLFPLTVPPDIAQWVKANEKPLALLTQAVTRPRFFIPFYGGYRPPTLVEVGLLYLKPMKHVGRAFHARALIRLQGGDIDGFRQDIISLHRLARLLGQGSTAVDRVVAMGLEDSACQAVRLAAAGGKMSSGQCRALIGELAALGDLAPIDQALNFSERYMVLDVSQKLASVGPVRAGELLNSILGGGSRSRYAPPWVFLFVPIPYEQTMRTMNHYYDSAIAAARQTGYPQRLAAIILWEREVRRGAGAGNLRFWSFASSDWALPVFLPFFTRFIQQADAARMENQLARVALALAAFKADRGEYPAALADLFPGYLPDVPNDLFAEKPLIYSRTDNGYTLRSVGPNMIDDAGKGDDLSASVP